MQHDSWDYHRQRRQRQKWQCQSVSAHTHKHAHICQCLTSSCNKNISREQQPDPEHQHLYIIHIICIRVCNKRHFACFTPDIMQHALDGIYHFFPHYFHLFHHAAVLEALFPSFYITFHRGCATTWANTLQKPESKIFLLKEPPLHFSTTVSFTPDTPAGPRPLRFDWRWKVESDCWCSVVGRGGGCLISKMGGERFVRPLKP